MRLFCRVRSGEQQQHKVISFAISIPPRVFRRASRSCPTRCALMENPARTNMLSPRPCGGHVAAKWGAVSLKLKQPFQARVQLPRRYSIPCAVDASGGLA